jgi:hypothetical protein
MALNDALDLSQIDPPIWRIAVAGVVYGPYTFGQMKSFAEEDRIRSHSSVANGDGGAFYLASEHPELSPLFADDTPTRTPEDAPEAANYLITIRTDGDGRRAMIALLNQMGRFAELMPGTFVLNAPVSALDLRNQLATVLAERGKFVIVNADSGQLAWMGLGADIDQHARTVWKRDL